MRTENSQKLFERAKRVIPGGVNSPVRAFNSVGGNPRMIVKGKGAYVEDADGNQMIDYVCSWGPLLLGHAHPRVVQAVQEAAGKGSSFGASTPAEVELAELVTQVMPSIEKIRFVSSGTEATMTAIRIARAATQREYIIKFAGAYHGHADAFLVAAGSGASTLGIPDSKGVTSATAQATLTAPYNDLEAVTELMTKHGSNVAAIIIEPIACNMGMVKPKTGFLEGLRKLCNQYESVLIFDEVITGFRVGLGGAQPLFDVQADLTTLGKIIGGGLPVGAVGGKAELMDLLAPLGPVYQAGTLSGNPLAMAAGLATLKTAIQENVYETLETKGEFFEQGLHTLIQKHQAPLHFDRQGSIFYLWCKKSEHNPSNYEEIKTADSNYFSRLFNLLLNKGVALAPSGFEVGFISSAHTKEILQETLNAFNHALTKIEH